MNRVQVRVFFVALVLAVLVTGASAEEVDAQDLVLSPVAAPKVGLGAGKAVRLGEAATVNVKLGSKQPDSIQAESSGLDALRKQNQEELERIEALKEQESYHRKRGRAAAEAAAKTKEAQEQREEALQKRQLQQKHVQALGAKIANADQSVQIMKQINEITAASKEKISELREKLNEATGTEASEGVEDAEAAQLKTIRETQIEITELQAKIASVEGCKNCDAETKSTQIASLQKQVSNAKRELEKQKAAKDTIELTAKSSVKKAAAAKTNTLQKEMDAARRKLDLLTSNANAKAQEEASMGVGKIKTIDSKSTVVASAAAEQEVKEANQEKVKEDADLKAKRDALIRLTEKRIKTEQAEAVAKAEAGAGAAGEKVVSKIQFKLKANEEKLAAEKKAVEVDAKMMKAQALAAAASGDVAQMALIQGKTSKALAAMHATQTLISEDKQALSEGQEWKMMKEVQAQAAAQKKVVEQMDAAKALAEKETTPQLQQRISDAQEKQNVARKSLTEKQASLRDSTGAIATKLANAAKIAALAEGTILKKKKEDAAKAHEDALKEQASGVSSPDAAAAMAQKMERIKTELKEADDAIAHAKVKAEGTEQEAKSISKQATVPSNDLGSLVQQMITLVSAKVADIASMVSRNTGNGLSEADKVKTTTALQGLRTTSAGMEDDLNALRTRKEALEKAKAEEKHAVLAMQFRSSIERVEKSMRRDHEGKQKIQAAKILMLKLEQESAQAEAKEWQKQAYRMIEGPGVGELQKEKKEIEVKLELAGQKEQKSAKVIDQMQTAQEQLGEDEAKATTIMAKLKKQQALVDKLPPGDSPERVAALEKLDELSKKQVEAEQEAAQAKKEAEAADTLTPQLKAASMAIDKVHKHIFNLMKRKTSLAALLGSKELAMKKADKEDEADAAKEAGEKVVETKENLQKNDEDYQKAESDLNRAEDKRAAVQRTIKKANDEVANEKIEKVDEKNEWVREMVHYAQKEKAFKKYGAESSHKHAEELKKHNDDKEKGYKREITSKNEKVAKAEEEKTKAAKRKIDMENARVKKAKELEEKKIADANEKSKKEETKGEIANKKAAETKFKAEAKQENHEKGEEAVKTKEKTAKQKDVFAHTAELSKETAGKKAEEFTNAKEAEVKGRTASEVQMKADVKKEDENILALNANTFLSPDAKSASIAAAKERKVAAGHKETAVKADLKRDAEKAADASAAAAKEHVTAKEKKDKTAAAANTAAAEAGVIQKEISDKVSKQKLEEEKAAQWKADTAKKEETVKIKKAAAVRENVKMKALFRIASDNMKRSENLRQDYMTRFTENRNKYVKFDQSRAAILQRVTLAQLADAKTTLAKDELLYKGAKTKEEEREYGNQVTEDKTIMKQKQRAADQDGKGVDKEKARKKQEMEAETTATNKLKLSETKLDIASKAEEKTYKSEKGFKSKQEGFSRVMDAKDEDREKALKMYELAKNTEKTAEDEKAYKEAKFHVATNNEKLKEATEKFDKAKQDVDVLGKESEQSSKEGQVKEKGAKYTLSKGKEDVSAAVTEFNAEVNTKLATRGRLASERHLKEKEQADIELAQSKARSEKAMKQISSAHTAKDFKEKMEKEKSEKKELHKAQVKTEKAEKKGLKENNRKVADKALYKQVMEKDLKARTWRHHAEKAANKASITERAKMEAMKQEAEAVELKGKANERADKVKTGIPGEKEAGEVPKEEPKEKVPNIDKEEAPVVDEKAGEEDKDEEKKYTSPYTKLAMDMEEEAKQSVEGSYHRRRRWVARRRAGSPDGVDADKVSPTSDKEEEKKGFSASFWSGVRGLKSIGDAILKISSMPATKKEVVDSIDYPATDGFWIGLNKKYQGNFVARFRGHINVPVSGDYTFYTRCADGCMLYINGKVVVKNDGMKDDLEEKSGGVTLKAGVADVVVDYFCATGKAGLIVEWKGPGVTRTRLSDKHVQAADHRELGESLGEDELNLGEDELKMMHAAASAAATAHQTLSVDGGVTELGSAH